MKKVAGTKLKLLFLILLILILAQAFNGGLSISSLEKLYVRSLISSYQVIGFDLRRNIVSALKFGKSLTKFVGIRGLLEEVKQNLPDLDNVMVLDTEGKILYSLDDSLVGKSWESLVGEKSKEKVIVSGDGWYAIQTEKKGYTVLPLEDAEGVQLGTISLSFKREVINQRIKAVVMENLKILGLATAGGFILLGLGLLFFTSFATDIRAQKKRLYAVIIVALISAQLGYSFFNIQLFKNQYLDIVRHKAEILTKLLKDDIEYLFKKGLSLKRLVKVDVLLSDIIQATPEIQDISILDTEGGIQYEANKSGVVKTNKDEIRVVPLEADKLYDFLVPLYKAPRKAEDPNQDKTIEGYIKVRLDRSVIGVQVDEITLDSATVVLISFLFVFELLILLFFSISRQIDGLETTTTEQRSRNWGFIRPVAFLYLLAMSLSQSFIPLQMELFYKPLWGLSKDVVLGLPISVEMLAAGLSLIPIGAWMDKRGWHRPFMLGVVFSIAGACFSWLASSAEQFIMARGVAGIGYGMTWLSVQGFVFTNTDQSSRARGISNLVAGIFAGQICGAAIGGMLAHRLGYPKIFFVAMNILALLLILALIFLRGQFKKPAPETAQAGRLSVSDFFRYFFNRQIFAVLWFGVVPLSMCIVGVLYYMSPIYIRKAWVTPSPISAAFS